MTSKCVSTGIAMLSVLAMLTACGGGGGDSSGSGSPPAAVTASLTPTSTKLFRFTWADAADETEYRLLENANGTSGFTQVATIAANTTTYDHNVFLPARVNARYIVQACNAAGCSDSTPTSVSGTLVAAVGYMKASNTEVGDQFGYSVALAADGNTLAVGAIGEASNATGIGGNQNDNTAGSSGAVYIFTRTGTMWSQQAYVKGSNTEAGDRFGQSIALAADGNTLAVVAQGEDSNAIGIGGDQTNNTANDSGAAYIFTRTGTTWSQQAYVKASNTGLGDQFGQSIALAADGNTVAVGAYAEASNATGIGGDQTNNTASVSGAVYVFTRTGSTWSQQAYVKASNTGASDYFGWSIALAADGNTLAVGAIGEGSNAIGIGGDQTNNTAGGSGAVYVFTRTGITWSQQAYVKASNTGGGDTLGVSIALAADGNTLAVGAYGEASNATGIGGDQTNNTAGGSGAVYVFTRSSTVWSQQVYVKASNTGTNDFFGRSIALAADGNTLAVGAFYEGSNATGIGGNQTDNTATDSGAVYIFTRTGTTWSQQAYVKASNTGLSDQFGQSIALAADGNTLAVGAFGEDSNATGVNGNQNDNAVTNSGAVYLY